MKRIIIGIVVLAVVTSGCLGPKWSKQDIIRQTAAMTLTAIDWHQTRNGVVRTGYYERNPILGEHPDQGTVDLWFLVGAALNLLIVDLLPADWRPYFQWGAIAVEGACVINNHRIGW